MGLCNCPEVVHRLIHGMSQIFRFICVLLFPFPPFGIAIPYTLFLLSDSDWKLCQLLIIFISRETTTIQKGPEGYMQNKHYCAMSMIMQTSYFRFPILVVNFCHIVIGKIPVIIAFIVKLLDRDRVKLSIAVDYSWNFGVFLLIGVSCWTWLYFIVWLLFIPVMICISHGLLFFFFNIVVGISYLCIGD